jgi:hypothetical protein
VVTGGLTVEEEKEVGKVDLQGRALLSLKGPTRGNGIYGSS